MRTQVLRRLTGIVPLKTAWHLITREQHVLQSWKRLIFRKKPPLVLCWYVECWDVKSKILIWYTLNSVKYSGNVFMLICWPVCDAKIYPFSLSSSLCLCLHSLPLWACSNMMHKFITNFTLHCLGFTLQILPDQTPKLFKCTTPKKWVKHAGYTFFSSGQIELNNESNFFMAQTIFHEL